MNRDSGKRSLFLLTDRHEALKPSDKNPGIKDHPEMGKFKVRKNRSSTLELFQEDHG